MTYTSVKCSPSQLSVIQGRLRTPPIHNRYWQQNNSSKIEIMPSAIAVTVEISIWNWTLELPDRYQFISSWADLHHHRLIFPPWLWLVIGPQNPDLTILSTVISFWTSGFTGFVWSCQAAALTKLFSLPYNVSEIHSKWNRLGKWLILMWHLRYFEPTNISCLQNSNPIMFILFDLLYHFLS